MKINVKGKTIILRREEVLSAKRVVSRFIKQVKHRTKNTLPTYYFTILIIMHIMSQELLGEMDDDTLEIIMNKLCK